MSRIPLKDSVRDNKVITVLQPPPPTQGLGGAKAAEGLFLCLICGLGKCQALNQEQTACLLFISRKQLAAINKVQIKHESYLRGNSFL